MGRNPNRPTRPGRPEPDEPDESVQPEPDEPVLSEEPDTGVSVELTPAESAAVARIARRREIDARAFVREAVIRAIQRDAEEEEAPVVEPPIEEPPVPTVPNPGGGSQESGSLVVRAYRQDRVVVRGSRSAWERLLSENGTRPGTFQERRKRVQVAAQVSGVLGQNDDPVVEVAIHPDLLDAVIRRRR